MHIYYLFIYMNLNKYNTNNIYIYKYLNNIYFIYLNTYFIYIEIRKYTFLYLFLVF